MAFGRQASRTAPGSFARYEQASLPAASLPKRRLVTGQEEILLPSLKLGSIERLQPAKSVNLLLRKRLPRACLPDEILQHHILEEEKAPDPLARLHRTTMRRAPPNRSIRVIAMCITRSRLPYSKFPVGMGITYGQ